jgi:hypothetical protein
MSGRPSGRWRAGLVAVLATVALAAGCAGSKHGLQHPTTNDLDPAYAQTKVKTLATLPFASDISESDDPDKIAASMSESKFYPALAQARRFNILPVPAVRQAVDQAGLTAKMAGFYKSWISDHTDVDEDFIRQVAAKLHVDGVVAGAVDVWHQKTVDVTESGAARTNVGILVGFFDGATGKKLWVGRDENYKDGLTYSGASAGAPAEAQRQVERTNQRTMGGAYAPPDYADVLELVVPALVGAFPAAAQ